MEDPIIKLKKRLQESRKSLNIARLPDKTKEEFVNLSNEEFCGDYGMCLREIFNCYQEHKNMKVLFFQNIDLKLDLLLNKNKSVEIEETPEGITMLDGKKRLKGGIKKNE